MADQGNRKGVAKSKTGDVRSLVLMTGGGEIHAVFLVPEAQMSEGGMKPVHGMATFCGQQVRNIVPTPLRNLRQAYEEIKRLSHMRV